AARGELDALAGRPDRGSHEAEYLLWQAELLYNRSAADSERADALIRRALELGLPESAREYVLGILAPTVPEAADHLRRAAAAVPYPLRARLSLAVILGFVGERAEARRHAEIGEALFPEDPNFHATRAYILALGGLKEESLAVLDRCRTQFR